MMARKYSKSDGDDVKRAMKRKKKGKSKEANCTCSIPIAALRTSNARVAHPTRSWSR
jgi:hypothetical protein